MGAFLTYLKGLSPKGKKGFAFGSYGWSGQSIGIVNQALEEVGVEIIMEPVKVNYIPSKAQLGSWRTGWLLCNTLTEAHIRTSKAVLFLKNRDIFIECAYNKPRTNQGDYMRICELREKEVINCRDCMRLGFVCDIEFDICTGHITHIIVPGPCKVWGILGRDHEYVISCCNIKQIGIDIILVDIDVEKCLVKL